MAFRMSEQARTIKIYNLLAGTNEFIGEGDAYIPPHTGLPANSIFFLSYYSPFLVFLLSYIKDF